MNVNLKFVHDYEFDCDLQTTNSRGHSATKLEVDTRVRPTSLGDEHALAKA